MSNSNRTTIPISVTNAQSNLTHYITMLMSEAGLTVDSDTYAELDEIITPVFETLDARITKLEQRLERRFEREADYEDYINKREKDHYASDAYGSDEDTTRD